ncbi:MAG TPA: ankyrin repeat domain-containing protein [Desulfomonilaceae bacterium]|nr:ankyrin repeat domain-containing protein [Desulfomonilaceae bacterium]
MFTRSVFPSKTKVKQAGMKMLRACIHLLLASVVIVSGFPATAESAQTNAGTEAPQQTATAPPLKTGDLYALVVGVSKYRDGKIPKLELSDKDARAFGDFLKAQNEVFKETRVTYLLNEKATKSEVEKHLYYTLPKAGKDDTVILFFSGHGAFDPIRPSEFLFLPYDVEPEFIGTTGVKMTGLEFLKGVNAERVLIIADACYAGGFSPMKSKSLPSMDSFLQEVRNSSGRAIITSAKPEQLSWEAPNAKNSVFTNNLLEGLKGKADKDKDGMVTLNEAYEYAYAKTKDETAGHQHPQFEGKIVGAFPLSFVGPRVPQAELKRRFLKAVETGKTEVFEQLLPRTDIETRDESNNTPLILAAVAGHAGMVKALLEKRANVDATNHTRATALSAASEKGYADIVQLLLAAGANVNHKNSEGMTSLALAAANGHTKVAEMLLQEAADLKARTNSGDTALSLAAADGRADTVKLLLKWGENLKSEELNAEEALNVAVRAGHSDVVKLLIVKTGGVKLQHADIQDRRLVLGVLRGDLKSLSELSEHQGHMECRTTAGDTPLILASYLGNKDIVKFLLGKGANVHAVTDEGTTPLAAAAQNGHTDVASLLLSAGADVNRPDKDGNTALILCSAKGKSDSVKLLLSKNPHVNARNGFGMSALLSAAKNGHVESVRQLVAGAADVQAADKEGDTALILAAAGGHPEVVKLLASKDADINAKNAQRRTPLIVAAQNGHTSVVKLLVSRGADQSVEDWEGKTALTIASEGDREEVVAILKSR